MHDTKESRNKATGHQQVRVTFTLRGTILQSKVEQSLKPLERFKKILFSRVLH